MEWHRNITHSLVMLPVWALLLAAVSVPLARWLRWKAPSFAKLAGIYAVGLASHVFLDVATSFGTMAWSPLNYSRVAWDWIFILDLTFTAIALVPQLAAWCYREPGKFVWRAGAVWTALSAGVLGIYAFAEVAGYGFPAWIVGIASAMMAALFFAPRIHGTGFRWNRASWSRAAHGRALRVCGVRRHGPPEGAGRRGGFCRLAPFACGKSSRASAAADFDALGRRDHHSRRRVANYVSSPERETGKRTSFIPKRAPIVTSRKRKSLRDVQVYLMVRTISHLAGGKGSRRDRGRSYRRAFLPAEFTAMER